MYVFSWFFFFFLEPTTRRQVTAISFSKNHIRSLVPFQKLPEYDRDVRKEEEEKEKEKTVLVTHICRYLPHCINLAFDNNKIADFKQLDSLKNIKLREIILTDNPISAKATYREEVTRRFPQLEYLDNQQIRPLFKFADIPDIVLPPEKPAFFDLEQNKNFAGTFVQKCVVVVVNTC